MQRTGTCVLRLGVLALAIAAIGLPVNDLFVYALLATSALVVFTGRVFVSPTRWACAILLAALTFAQHLLFSAPRIEEGHNVFLIDQTGGALEKGLPADAYAAMAQRFNAAYPAEKRCKAAEPLCWRPQGIPERVFAFAADGVFDGHAHSRRVSGIDFGSATWLRLGIVNDLSLDFLGHEGDVERLRRDRRSLAIFGRWQNKIPFFLMYRFPLAFAGSDLCWRGELLWEQQDERFAPLNNRDWGCRTLQPDDIGRRVFAVSIGPDADLAMTLRANWTVKLRRALDAATTVIGVIGVLALLVRWRPARMKFPLLLMVPAFAVIVLVDATFIGGYRTLDGGDDGLIFSGFARRMLAYLASGDFAGAVEGVEKVFFFTPGMRYFRTLEYLVFGDTYLGYFTVMLAAPLAIHAVSARFLGGSLALALTLVFVATPLGALFGTSYVHYAVWSARGFADPLAATIFLVGLTLLAGRPGISFDSRVTPAFWGALVMALAVFIRPNLAPGAGVLLGGVGLAALWQTQFARLAALCLGFAPVLFMPWHNWYFGSRFVPIGDNATAQSIYVVPPSVYWDALREIARLDFAGANLRRALDQAALLLSGPSGSVLLIPLHIAAFALVIRVACARRFEPMLRLTALVALALSLPGYVYLVSVRYHLAMWFLVALVVVAWFASEGSTLLDRYRPGWRERVAAAPAFAATARAFAKLQRFAGLAPEMAP